MTALAVIAVAIVSILVVAASTGSTDTAVTTTEAMLTVHDGPNDEQRVRIDTTLFVPDGVDADHPAPAIVIGHGFGGSKDDVEDDAVDLARAGYVVLSFSARGFGESGGQIALNSPDYEVKDARQLIDWLARRPEVQRDSTGDPRVGMTGASYGGAIALLTAAYDDRVDAIAPIATWNDLRHSLFPGGVFAKSWAGILFAQGGAGRCGRFQPVLCAEYERAAQAGRLSPRLSQLLARSSPASVLDRIDAPTLLVQGETDTLFPLSEANATARGLDAPVKVAWFAGGHDASGDELAETSRIHDLTVDWMNRWLRHEKGTDDSFTFSVPRRSDATIDLDQRQASSYDFSHRSTLPLIGPAQEIRNPAGGTPTAVSNIPGLAAQAGLPGGTDVSSRLADSVSIDIPGQSAAFASEPLESARTIVGAPTVRINVTSSSREVVLFGKLYDVGPDGDRELPGRLVTPLRLTDDSTVTVRLPTIAHTFAPDHRLVVVFATTDQAYASPSAPATYRVALADAELSLPTIDSTKIGGDDEALPWLLTAGGLGLLGLVGLVIAGRPRRRHSTPDPSLTDVPLVIDGLSKSYGDVHAVAGLSLRVERGQVVGLLGPNGAGKSTALRALMGLVKPSSGRTLVYGHEVRAGAPVLARIGSFVEGPGALPHLSGLDNLRIYWRSTGRPESDAHFDEALRLAGLGAAVHRKAGTYSQGMRQRLALAQAMLGLPELLVLDEPANGLDPPQIRTLRDTLHAYVADGQRTVLLSSHLLAEVELTCTHVVVMDRGHTVASGTVAEVVGGGTTVHISVSDADSAIAVVQGLSAHATRQGDGLVVDLGDVPTADIVAALVHAGVAVHTIAPQRRLEDAFVSLVGQGTP